jgi:hypothetical protein
MEFLNGEVCESTNTTRRARITFACTQGSDLVRARHGRVGAAHTTLTVWCVVQGQPVLMGEDHCYYDFVWQSSAACAVTGMSGGAIFMIVYAPVRRARVRTHPG